MAQPETISVDVAIIGAGTAGMTAYRAAKRAGKRVVLIESGPYGTMCARVGCMPSKLLIAAADRAHSARTSAPFGVHPSAIHIDGAAVMQRVRDERDRFVGFVVADVDGFDDADKLHGQARFMSDTTLQVGDRWQLTTQASVIATGSTPIIPPVLEGLGDKLVVNDDVFDWQQLPRRILVVGAGVIGLELGQALARLGVKTTIINRSQHLAGIQDPEVLQSAREALENELDIRFDTEVVQAQRVGDEVHAVLSDQQEPLVVDCVLAAVGRQPVLSDLGLEHTSVQWASRQQPEINPTTLQLAPAPIFIAGDVTGAKPLLHEAADEGRLAGQNASQYPQTSPGLQRSPLSIVFSDPQIARVGTAYNTLDHDNIVIGEVSFVNQGRSRIMLKNQGKLRVYAQRQDGLFVGAVMAGPNMEHIAHLLAWSHQQKLTVGEMLAMPFYHPVIEEGLRTALRQAHRQVSA